MIKIKFALKNNNNSKYQIRIITCVYLFTFAASYAVAIENTCYIDYETVTKKAIEHSYDLKLADYETMISKTGITSARSEYFPKLNFMAGTEYTKNFRDVANWLGSNGFDMALDALQNAESKSQISELLAIYQKIDWQPLQ